MTAPTGYGPRVSDYATNDRENITCTQERQVQIDNTCADAGVSGDAALSAQFRQPKRKRRGKQATGPVSPTLLKLPVPGPAVIRGRLTDAGGGPVAGAVLCVREQVLGAGRTLTRHTVRTGPDGAFRHKLGRGPNRRVTFGYRRGQGQIDSSLTYKAWAKPRLKLSHRTIKNRGRLRLKGRIPGPAKAGRIGTLRTAPSPGTGPLKQEVAGQTMATAVSDIRPGEWVDVTLACLSKDRAKAARFIRAEAVMRIGDSSACVPVETISTRD